MLIFDLLSVPYCPCDIPGFNLNVLDMMSGGRNRNIMHPMFSLCHKLYTGSSTIKKEKSLSDVASVTVLLLFSLRVCFFC